MSQNKKLLKFTGIIGLSTFASRILGFARDVLFARLFGTDIYAQAFVVAFRLPNMLRDLIGEGATNAAIVPVLSKYRHSYPIKRYWQGARSIFLNLVLVMGVVIIVGFTFAPFLVKILAPGFVESPEKFSYTVLLTKLLLPYIFFLGLVSYCNGILNSFDYFLTPALSPVLLNICMVVALVYVCPVVGVKGLVIGIYVGGIAEVLLQVPQMYKKGFRWINDFKLIHPASVRVWGLLIPRMVGSAVYQLSILIDTVMASLSVVVGAGGVAALYYAHRLTHLPLAIFGISLATAVLPRMSREAAAGDNEGLKKTMAFSLGIVFLIMIPASVGLMVLSDHIIRLLFQRGEFTEYSTSITSNALYYYTFGLAAFAGIKILVSAFFSLGDTKTPVKTASMALFINFVLILIFMWKLKIGGLALATSVAAIWNFGILYVMLVKKIGDFGTKGLARDLVKISVSSVLMGVLTHLMGNLIVSGVKSNIVQLALLGGDIALSGIFFIVLAWLFGIGDVRRFVKGCFRRVGVK
ncbi:MAG: murein biosynthesis integral membrane protein MurJ [Candidatus Omnitrophica bacterium]|nr:murein biosynthesis integral membrane protein MurJ [Candidatus Omnitrophota bacterium]